MADDKAARAAKRLANIEQRLEEVQRSVTQIQDQMYSDSRKIQSILEILTNSSGVDRTDAGRPRLGPKPPSAGGVTPRPTAIELPVPWEATGLTPISIMNNSNSNKGNEPKRLGLGGSLRAVVMNKLLSRDETEANKSPPKKDDEEDDDAQTQPSVANLMMNATSIAFPDTGPQQSGSLAPNSSGDIKEAAGVTPNKELQTLQQAREQQKKASRGDGSHHEESYDVDGFFVSLFDVLFIITSVFTCMFVISLWHPRTEVDFDAKPSNAMLGWLAFVYFVSAGWMYLRFFIRSRIGDWEVVDDLPSIRAAYLKSWFAYDIIFTAPIDLIFIGWANRAFYFLLLRHFLRYFRQLSLGRSVNPLLGFRMWFGFFSYVSTMMLVAHVVGNIFWEMQGQNQPQLTYIQSIYWATASMTSVGYGDFVATTDNARAFACFAMFLGIMMIATFSAFATAFVLDKDAIEIELAARKAMMHSMLRYYDIPWSMQREVIQIMPAALAKSTESQFRQELDLLPAFIQAKLTLYFNAHTLRQIPLFSESDQDLMLELSKKMKKVFVPKYDFVYHEGDAASEMFFVSRGVVELLVQSATDFEIVQQLRDGRWFGEEIFKSDEKPTRSLTAQATTNCELISLDKDALASIVASDVKVKDSVLFEYRARRVQVAKAHKAMRRRSHVPEPEAPPQIESKEEELAM